MSIDNKVKVIAEVWHVDAQDAYLLGEDLCLYRTHMTYKSPEDNINDPFNQYAKNKILSDEDMVNKILEYSVVTTRSGSTYMEGDYDLEVALNDA